MSVGISDAAQLTGLSISLIRHYEARGLLGAVRRGTGNARLYAPRHIAMLRFARYCRQLGFPIEEILGLVQAAEATDRAATLRIAHKQLAELERQRGEIMRQIGELEAGIEACEAVEDRTTALCPDFGRGIALLPDFAGTGLAGDDPTFRSA